MNWAIDSNADILSKGRQTWEIQKSTTCAKAYNSFETLIKNNLGKTPRTLIECLIFWYELYQYHSLEVRVKTVRKVETQRFIKTMNTRVTVGKNKFVIRKKKIVGKGNVTKWQLHQTSREREKQKESHCFRIHCYEAASKNN